MARLPGVHVASWGGFAFSRWVVNARDNFGASFFAHRIPHRNGAKQEQTGNVPFQVTYSLEFAGRGWADDARLVLGKFVGTPRNDLVHHLKGKLRAVCMPIDASWDPVNKGTHYAATVTLIEDTLTNNASFDRSPGTVSQDLSADADAADTASSSFVSDVFGKYKVGIPALRLRAQVLQAQKASAALTAAARDYAAAAVAQFQAGQLQPVLATKLNRLPQLLDAAVAQHRALPSVSPYSQVAVSAGERVLYDAELLDKAIRANLPPPIYWEVREQVSLFVLVGRLYPTRSFDDKAALMAQIAVQNGLSRPDALRAGLRIQIPAP